MSKKKSELSGWTRAIDRVFENSNRRNFGYNQMTLNYMNDCAKTIQRLSTEMNWAWVNRDNLKLTEEQKANYFAGVKKELDKMIELLKTYSEPVEEDE